MPSFVGSDDSHLNLRLCQRLRKLSRWSLHQLRFEPREGRGWAASWTT